MSREVLLRVPEGMLREIERYVKAGLYRSVSDFFYVAGQKELGRLQTVEVLREEEEESEGEVDAP